LRLSETIANLYSRRFYHYRESDIWQNSEGRLNQTETEDRVNGVIGGNGKKFFYHNDHEGSALVVTDENGNKVVDRDFAPFGEKIKTNNREEPYSDETEDGFTGKDWDEDVGYITTTRDSMTRKLADLLQKIRWLMIPTSTVIVSIIPLMQ
jgi:hypothetical protein